MLDSSTQTGSSTRFERFSILFSRVLKDWKEKDANHVAWVKAWIATLTELQGYVKKNHTTGLTWNPQGAAAAAPAGGAGGEHQELEDFKIYILIIRSSTTPWTSSPWPPTTSCSQQWTQPCSCQRSFDGLSE